MNILLPVLVLGGLYILNQSPKPSKLKSEADWKLQYAINDINKYSIIEVKNETISEKKMLVKD